MIKNLKIFSKQYTLLSGSIHIHTKYSYDSKAEPKDIIDAAKKRGLDYLMISDHSNNKAKDDKIFKNEDKIFVVIGAELNDKNDNNHYLVFGEENIQLFDEAKSYSDYYFNKDNTFTIAAHPFDKRAVKSMKKYVWENPDNTNFHSIEIWNAVSDWIEGLKPSKNGFFYVFFPSLFIKKADKDSLKWWDYLNAKGIKKSAVGSSDAHTFLYKKFGKTFKFLPHKFLFGTVRTNILIPKEKEINKKNILLALKRGNSYIVNYKVGYPDGFYAGLSDNNGNSAIYGEEIYLSDSLNLYFRSPYLVKAKCYKNGEKIAEYTDNKGFFKIKEKGVYRLEIERNFRKWIYTNNFYVK